MLDWLGKMINLPPQFLAGKDGEGGGVIQVRCYWRTNGAQIVILDISCCSVHMFWTKTDTDIMISKRKRPQPEQSI